MNDFSRSFSDEQLMDLALRLGRRGAGATAENPAVGCVIARNNAGRMEIVGRGWTQEGGRPHAERVALAEAGTRAREATAYVTLEPCSHTGQSSPCADALVEAGITRVVCAHPDPDHRVAGRGFEKLRNAGVSVDVGLMGKRARQELAGFLSRTVRKRPWLQVKMAFSSDGMIGLEGVGNYPVTGALAKSRTYALRLQADAILVGCDTVLIDDPALTVRLPGLERRSPTRVVLDSKGRIPVASNLVQTARDIPVWIVTSEQMPADKALKLQEYGCTLLCLNATASGHIDLKAALESLAERGINAVFAECGAKLGSELLQSGLVDAFFLYQGAGKIGAKGLLALGGQPEAALAAGGFILEENCKMGTDRLKRFVRPESLEALYGD
nr:bifunctional diaminohydroxyphosphoribosylaminopyrimidine deaminase/5-amino-6-(5-phosphoribosylamino)uracil reductase RibD [uncultured Cohaesibacter sp.]